MSILRYANALRAEQYRVQLKNRLSGQARNISYTSEQLNKSERYLRLQNSQGFDVYCRPVGWQYVLLDDLTRAALTEVAKLQPCLLIETSPANYQAWLILSNLPESRDQARETCLGLARMLGADTGSADPDHVGRLPGFTNRKEKYQQPDGLFPFVKLHRSEHRLSTFESVSNDLIEAPSVATRTRSLNAGGSTSEREFGIVLGLLKKRRTDQEIRDHLLATCLDLESRKGKHAEKYISITIHNAKKVLGNF